MKKFAILSCFVLSVLGHEGPEQVISHRALAAKRMLEKTCAEKNRGLQEGTCIAEPEVTLGPFYRDDAPIRKNITEDGIGVPFKLFIEMRNATDCSNIAALPISIWHCDVSGLYSHYLSNTRNVEDDSTFLRGIQFTNDEGIAEFDTIFPGWYQGRTIHIHIRTWTGMEVIEDSDSPTGQTHFGGDNSGGSNGDTTQLNVAQLYVPDEITELVEVLAPYNENTVPRTTNSQDRFIVDGFGMMEITEMFPGEGLEAGMIARATVAVDGIFEASTTFAPTSVNDTEPDPGLTDSPENPTGSPTLSPTASVSASTLYFAGIHAVLVAAMLF